MACPNCGTSATHSDRTGCCGACKRLFKGLTAFDRHRVSTDDGDRECLDPLTLKKRNGNPVFEQVAVNDGIAYRLVSGSSPWEET